jgi:hypothetical protein
MFDSNTESLLQCTKEGAYILFALLNSTTIKSTINSYLTTLNLLIAFLSTKDESLKAQGPFTIQVRFFKSIHLCLVQPHQGEIQKEVCWLVQLFSALALAHLT